MKVRKIAALAVGAAMVGATIGLAEAQPTVPNIPKEFFVKDGEPNVKIVVGSQAAAADVASAADIAVALGSLLYTEEEAKATGVEVTVKKDVTDWYDPEDIPIYSTLGVESWTKNTEYEDLGAIDAWYNAASGNYESDYAVPVPEDGFDVIADFVDGTAYYATIDDVESIIPASTHAAFKVGDTWMVVMSKGEEYKLIDYNIEINKLIVYGYSDKAADNDLPPKDAKVEIPAGQMKVTLDFTIEAWEKVKTDYTFGYTYTKYYYDDSYLPAGDANAGNLKPGIEPGDTFTLFGNKYTLVNAGYDTNAGKDFMKLGHQYLDQWINVDEVKEFDGYKIKALDLSPTSPEKALLEITSPSGETEIVALASGETKTLFNGAFEITLDGIFVGVSGTLSAQVDVTTNIQYVYDGDDEFIDGYEIDITTDGSVVTQIILTNTEDIKGSSIELFDTYVVQYVFNEYKKEVGENKYYAVNAYVAIDPKEKHWLTLGTVKDGETITDYYVYETYLIEVSGKVKEYTIMHPTEPITYLDTDFADLAAVDSNLILVGGPVVNAVTAALAEDLEIPSDYDGWKEKYGTGADSGVVIYKEELEKINGFGVVLVAGTDREGTAAAAKALMEYLSNLG